MGTSPTQASKSDGESGTNERRAVLRRNVVDSHLVTVDLAFQTGALVLDLSESGVGVQALSSAPLGASTSLQFDLPETGGRVDAVGRIAWTDSSGRLGISFEDIAELSRVYLAQWLSRERRPAVAAGGNVTVPTWPPAYARDEIAALRRDLITEKLEGDAALTFVVERIRNVTRATGAAIALDNEGGAVTCRASSGNAPGVGARLDPNSGLSGECIRTGEIVRCEDTETDPRADRLVCRKLELRSIVIVPIRVQGRPAGVLEAFSSRAHAFQSSDVLWLRRVTDLVAGIAVRQPELNAITGPQALMAAVTLEPPARESDNDTETPLMMEDVIGIQEEISPPSPPATKPTGPAERFFIAATPPPSRDSLAQAEAPLPAEAINPLGRPAPPILVPPLQRRTPRVVLTPVEEADAPAKTPEVTPLAAFAPPAISTIRPAEIQPRPTHTPSPARDWLSSPPPTPVAVQAMGAAAAPAPAPTTRLRRLEFEDENEVGELPSFMREPLSPSAQASSPWRLRITGAGILLVVVAVGGWQVWRAVASPKATPVDSGPRQQSPSSTSTPLPVLTSTTTLTVPAPVPVKTSPVTATPAPKTSPPTTQAKAVAPADSTKITSAPATAAPRPAATTTAPIEVAKIEVTEAPPPAIGLVRTASVGSNISSVLSAPVAAPSLDRPVVSEMSGGKLLRRVDPTYPSSAPSSGLRGEVVLKATIDKKGNVSKVSIVSGHALLAQAAANAVRRWQYEPFRLNGVPIEIENTIVVNFKSPGR